MQTLCAIMTLSPSKDVEKEKLPKEVIGWKE
jgi:hypothetical protein